MNLDPALVMSMWASGLAGAAALVNHWDIVGRGYVWLTTATVLLIGGLAAIAGAGVWAWVGCGLVIAGAVVSPPASWVAMGASAIAFLASTFGNGPFILSILGAAVLGGITSEMMLGHWFLIDPRLPRWSLHRLTAIGGGAIVLDALALYLGGIGFDSVTGLAFVVLAAGTLVLMLAVWFALKEPSYTGVMAGTGLSYLATLTAVGAVVAGRAEVADIAGFPF